MADVMKDRVWNNVPPVGSQAREEMPAHAFLDPENKRYPFKRHVDGQWKISCAGLLAAYRRAIANKEPDIASKAQVVARQNKCPWATE